MNPTRVPTPPEAIDSICATLQPEGWSISKTDEDLIALRPGLRLTLRYRPGRAAGAWRCRLSDGSLRFQIAKAYASTADDALAGVLPDARAAARRMDGDSGLLPNAGKGWWAYRRWLATRT
jgi:hypothetical protein